MDKTEGKVINNGKLNLTPGTSGTDGSICGATASITVGEVVGEVTDFTFKRMVDLIDVTSMNSDSWNEFIGCLQSAEGSFSTFVSMGVGGVQAGVVFVTGTGGTSYTTDIIVKEIEAITEVAGAIKYTYSWVSTGVITGF